MSAPAWLLGALVTALASAGGGYWYGTAQGQAIAAARQDSQAVQDLTGLITSQKALIGDATRASTAMRQLVAQRRTADQQSTQDIKNALSLTADQRAGCVFDDGLMRQLDQARARAADAAASGIRGGVQQPAAAAGQPGS